MRSWTARARAIVLETEPKEADETDEITHLTVSSVPTGAINHQADQVSTVSSVGCRTVSENLQLPFALLEAAMKVCDQHGDSDAAKKEMREQCLAMRPNLQQDLLDHFRGKPVIFTSDQS